MAQFGRALRSGRRGRWFKSSRIDTRSGVPSGTPDSCIHMNEIVPAVSRSERFGRRGSTRSSGPRVWAERSGAENAGSNPVASIQKTDTSRYPFFLYVFSVRRFVSGFAFLSDRLKRGDRQIDGQNNQHNCDNRLYDIPRILSCHFDLRDDRQDQ